jgi:hypothetical protein
MLLQYTVDLLAHVILLQRLVGNPKTDGHNFHCDDPQLSICRRKVIVLIQLSQKIYVGIETNPDAMDEEDWGPGLRCVRAVPVRESFGSGFMATEERDWAEGEDGRELKKRSSVELEGVINHATGRYHINNEYALKSAR